MVARVISRAVLVVLATLIVTGCGRPAASEQSTNLDLLAAGPSRETLPVPRPFIAAAIDATGSLATWMQARKLDFYAVVTAYQPDGGFYLSEHHFGVYPWIDAIQVEAKEPRTDLLWQVVGGEYRLVRGDRAADVSPLSGIYREYADAALQITTAPVRLLEDNVTLLHRPVPVMASGQWYYLIEATFGAAKSPSGQPQPGATKAVEPYWTQAIYFQDQSTSLVDMIWLANPVTQKFLGVRGYDYRRIDKEGILVPTKIEILQADAQANMGQRLAVIDMKR